MIRRSGNRFADKIMRDFKMSARDRAQNRCPLLLIARYGVAGNTESILFLSVSALNGLTM